MKRIIFGRDTVSLMDPPNEGVVMIEGREWKIGRNGQGAIVLRDGLEVHPSFVDGMFMAEFCSWLNEGEQYEP